MATLISTIITDAYREANLIALGGSESTAQQTEALRLLQRFILSLYGSEMGVPLTTRNYGNNNLPEVAKDTEFEQIVSNYFVLPNSRLNLNLETAKTVKLNPFPQDGERFAINDSSGNLATYNLTVSGAGRSIEDASSVTVATDGISREWFYRADTANWVRVSDLATTDYSPFPVEFDEFLIIGLSMRLASRYGTPTFQESGQEYIRLRTKFRARYSPSSFVPLEEALARAGNYDRFTGEYNRNSFEQGYVL